MSGWVLLVMAIIGAGLAANALWPSRGPWAMMPSWLGVFLTVDLVFHHFVLQIIVVMLFNWLGAFETAQGRLAIPIMLVSSLALLWVWLPASRASRAADVTAGELGLPDLEPLPRARLLLPFARTRKGVEVQRNIEFFYAAGKALSLDVFQPDMRSDDRPALVYVHGGGFLMGDKRDQGLPLCNHMASLGWVCFNINYRLSPAATWPDHLVDAKAAIAWVREHADEYGVDPNFVAIAGGSAGGQIASMAALTADASNLQPGFENADTSVQAVVTSYSIYDLTNRHGAHNPEFLTRMIGPLVLKADPETEMEKFAAASPRDRLHADAPPWLVLHGSDDPLVPVVEAQDFFAALRKKSAAMCGYVEFPGASHAFDVYYCHRAAAAVDLTARFLVSASNSSKDASRQSA